MPDLALFKALANAAFCREHVFRDWWGTFSAESTDLLFSYRFQKPTLQDFCEDLRNTLFKKANKCHSGAHPNAIHPQVFGNRHFFQQELVDRHLSALDKPMFLMQSSAKQTVTHTISIHHPHNRLKSRRISLPGCHQWFLKYKRSNRRHPHLHKITSQNNLNDVNRKGFHSFCAGDAQKTLMNSVARWNVMIPSFCRTALLAYTLTGGSC